MKTIAITLTLAATVAAIYAADVNGLWDQHCVSCHGKDGSGKTKMGQKSGVKDYRDPKVQAELKDDTALKAVKEGITENGKEKMKPFKDKLSDDEIKALIGRLKEFGKK
ncbi:MAG TPA: cytochrome c [Verrucomicrobiae bacterium]